MQRPRRFPGLPGSLRGRLVLWNMLVLLLTLVLVESCMYLVITRYLMSGVDSQLQQRAVKLQALTLTWQVGTHPFDTHFFDQLVQVDQSDEFTADSPYIKLLDAHDGHLLRRSPNLVQARLPLNLADFRAALQSQSPLATYRDTTGRQVRMLTVALRDTSKHTVVVAQVGQPLTAVNQVSFLLALALCLGGLCAAVVAYIGGFWFIHRELRPLRALSATMRTQQQGGRLPPGSAGTELQQLTDALNQMTARLEASATLQRSFVADVSHELRTPLTTIRGLVDVVLLNPELDGETQQDLQQIRAGLMRMSRLLNNLLMNARAEVGVLPQVPPERQQLIDLDELAIEVARQARLLNQTVQLQLGELQQVTLAGDSDLLKQLLLNLIDNALAYTPAGGSVSLAVARAREIPDTLRHATTGKQRVWARIDVCDTGPGIAPAELPHIFERYYRADHLSARGRLSSGLGLTIALLIAQAHDGTITVESAVNQGTCFHTWLPAREDA